MLVKFSIDEEQKIERENRTEVDSYSLLWLYGFATYNNLSRAFTFHNKTEWQMFHEKFMLCSHAQFYWVFDDDQSFVNLTYLVGSK